MIKKKNLSKRANFLLVNLAAQTHPDQEFVEWVLDENKDLKPQQDELIEAGFIKESENGLVPTTAGIDYLQKGSNTSVDDLIKRITNVIPRNPSFTHMAQNLTDTGLMGAIYALLGEIGRRGDPDNQTAYTYWNKKCADLEKVLTGADPNSLWVRHNEQQEKF